MQLAAAIKMPGVLPKTRTFVSISLLPSLMQFSPLIIKEFAHCKAFLQYGFLTPHDFLLLVFRCLNQHNDFRPLSNVRFLFKDDGVAFDNAAVDFHCCAPSWMVVHDIMLSIVS